MGWGDNPGTGQPWGPGEERGIGKGREREGRVNGTYIGVWIRVGILVYREIKLYLAVS